MKVIFANWLEAHLFDFDEIIQTTVTDFAIYVENHGLHALQGRNKSSVVPNPHTKRQQADFKLAQKFCLWHYHLGIPEYVEQANGELTSQMLLHYIRQDDFIVLIDVAPHPPFDLPNIEKLVYNL